MNSVVPSYLEHLVNEGAGDPDAVKAELLLCLVQAIEANTKAIEELHPRSVWEYEDER